MPRRAGGGGGAAAPPAAGREGAGPSGRGRGRGRGWAAAAAAGCLLALAGGVQGRDAAYQGEPVAAGGCTGESGGTEGDAPAPPPAGCGTRACEFSSPVIFFDAEHACCGRPERADFGGGLDRRCPTESPRPASPFFSGDARAEQTAFLTTGGEIRDLGGVWANPEVCRMEMLYSANEVEEQTNSSGTYGTAEEGALDTAKATYLCMVLVPAQRTGFAAAAVGAGRLLVHGGLAAGGQILGDLWELRGDTGTWKLLHSMQGMRIECCSGKPKWRVEHAGDRAGRTMIREGDAADRFIVDVAPGATAVPPPRSGHTATVVTSRGGRQQLVIVGGFDPARGNLEDVWTYDIASGEWEEKAPLRDVGEGSTSGYLGRSGHAAFADGDSLVVHGGNLLSDLWRFNLTENRWHVVQLAESG